MVWPALAFLRSIVAPTSPLWPFPIAWPALAVLRSIVAPTSTLWPFPIVWQVLAALRSTVAPASPLRPLKIQRVGKRTTQAFQAPTLPTQPQRQSIWEVHIMVIFGQDPKTNFYNPSARWQHRAEKRKKHCFRLVAMLFLVMNLLRKCDEFAFANVMNLPMAKVMNLPMAKVMLWLPIEI